MGKILETTYHDSVKKITGFHTSLIGNSFYNLSDKKPTIVTYYNINKEASTLDPGSKIAYDNIGDNTPLRFNKIEDFMIFGFNRIELNTENDEFGLEAEKIVGDCYVLPNTITPTEGDYFEVEHIKDSSWLFIITDVQKDTLENGSNVYKLTYKLEYVDHERILNNVVQNFRMIEKREGTNIVKIVENTKYDIAKRMDDVAVMLKSYFNELFYNPAVQTFTYMDLTEWRVYDQYMIEFLIRNKILENGNDSFIYVCHQVQVPKTFSLEYDHTFFRAFEKRDLNLLGKSEYTIELEDIIGYGTTFYSRFETYFKTKYNKPSAGYRMETIPEDILFKIRDNELIEDIPDLNEPTPLWINILVKYFNGGEYTENEIQSIVDWKYDTSTEAFYIIPLLIFCLEYSIENVLK